MAKQEKHRVVQIRQESNDRESREKVSRWVTPDQAETLSDKWAQDIADDPVRYVLIESNQKEETESCPL